MLHTNRKAKSPVNPANSGYFTKLKAALIGMLVFGSAQFFHGNAHSQELAMIDQGIATQTAVKPAHLKVLQWKEFLNTTLSAKNLTIDEKLNLANSYWNALRQVNDIDLYGREDVWTTPEETLAMGAGDCEDLAIGKYFSLMAAGISESQLMLGHVKLAGYGAHMVLIYTDENNTRWVLDNMNTRVERLADRKDLNLVYTLNGQELRFASMAHVKANPFTVAHWKGIVERVNAGVATL